MGDTITNASFKNTKAKELGFGKRRGEYFDVNDILKNGTPLSNSETEKFEKLDLIYRTLCAILYNFVPTSGHPGGSISSGRFVESLVYNIVDMNITNPFADEIV